MHARVAATIAVCFMLAGCVSHPTIPFDKTTAGDIKTIGVVTPAMHEQPYVWLATDLGQSFGLIGALVSAGLENAREDKFWKEIDGANHPPRAVFSDAVVTALQSEGYTAKIVDAKRDDYMKTYPKDAGVDAFLDIVVTSYGYVAAGMADATPYRPFTYVKCKLIRASDNAVLMQDTVVYNYLAQSGMPQPGVTLDPDPQYIFVDFDALQADPPKATKGLHETLQKVATTVANLAH